MTPEQLMYFLKGYVAASGEMPSRAQWGELRQHILDASDEERRAVIDGAPFFLRPPEGTPPG